MRQIWKSNKLGLSTKLKLYASGPCSVLSYGHQAWLFKDKLKRRLRYWNACCLHRITGRDHREETVDPSYDLVAGLQARRLRWLGHTLRTDKLTVRVLEEEWAILECFEGTIFEHAPRHGSFEELTQLAQDRESWRLDVNALKN